MNRAAHEGAIEEQPGLMSTCSPMASPAAHLHAAIGQEIAAGSTVKQPNFVCNRLNRLWGVNLHRRLGDGIVGWPGRVMGRISLFVWVHVPVGRIWCAIGSSDLRRHVIEHLRLTLAFNLSSYCHLRGHDDGRKERKVQGKERNRSRAGMAVKGKLVDVPASFFGRRCSRRRRSGTHGHVGHTRPLPPAARSGSSERRPRSGPSRLHRRPACA